MARLVFLGNPQTIRGHEHKTDTSVAGAISVATPMLTPTHYDPLNDLNALGRVWGESPMRYLAPNLRESFWSLLDLEQWVESTCNRDLFVSCDESQTYRFATFDLGDMNRMSARFIEPKGHRISGKGDALLLGEIRDWLRENASEQYDLIDPSVSMGSFYLKLFFRSEEDATLFRVRWRGHGALTID